MNLGVRSSNLFGAATSNALSPPNPAIPAPSGMPVGLVFLTRPLSTRSDQNFCRDTEPFMQAADHRDRESPLPVQDLGDPGARADDLFQIPSREPLLLSSIPSFFGGLK